MQYIDESLPSTIHAGFVVIFTIPTNWKLCITHVHLGFKERTLIINNIDNQLDATITVYL